MPSFAQSKEDKATAAKAKKELRKQNRQVREQAFIEDLEKAIISGEFVFTAQSFQANVGSPTPINAPNNYVGIYDGTADVQLPFYSFSAIGGFNLLRFTSTPIDYEVALEKGSYVVTIGVKRASGVRTSITMNGNFKLVFKINAKSGSAVLNLTPEMSTTSTYSGIVKPN